MLGDRFVNTSTSLTIAFVLAASACGRIGFDEVKARRFVASNDVPTDVAIAGGAEVSLAGSINSTTGAITGDLTRAPGEGLDAGVHFARLATPTGALGVFTAQRFLLANLTVEGDAPIVFVATEVEVTGTVSVSAMPDSSDGGPGGANGATRDQPAPGTCAAGSGLHVANATVPDGGGGGGGGGTAGAAGGTGQGVALGGTGGAACLPMTLIPLGGGGGGGLGGWVAPVPPCEGGGGGGALQISALVRITLTAGARLTAAGAGGRAGSAVLPVDSGGGCGGGGGGGILLESPSLEAEAGAGVYANGGGGGGAAYDIDATGGANGESSPNAAVGGSGSSSGNGGAGGAGGALASPSAGADGAYNGGGGGGAAGRIVLRFEEAPGQALVTSPVATELPPLQE